jgi:phage tail tape-measure protein
MAVIVSWPLYSDITSFCSFSAVTLTRKGNAVVSGVSESLPHTSLAVDSTIVLLLEAIGKRGAARAVAGLGTEGTPAFVDFWDAGGARATGEHPRKQQGLNS